MLCDVLLVLLKLVIGDGVVMDNLKDEFYFPKLIWMYWERNMPEDVEEMVEITMKSLSEFNFPVYFLTNTNLSEFLNVSGFPNAYQKLSPVMKSCYIRICLVEKFGGFYVDSTIMINSGHEMEYIYSEGLRNKSQLISFKQNDWCWVCPVLFGAPINSSCLKGVKEDYDIALKSKDLKEHIRGVYMKYGLSNTPIKIKWIPIITIDILFRKVIIDQNLHDSIILLPPERSGHLVYTQTLDMLGKYYEDIKDIPIVKVMKEKRTGKRLKKKSIEV